MKRLLLFLALFLPSLAFGQNSAYQTVLFGPTGRPLAGATVTVCSSSGIGIPCSPTVNIFNAAGVGISNPTFSDGQGNLEFWAPPGTYIYTITGNGITPTTKSALLPCIVGSSCGGASPLGNNGDLQMRNGALLAASGENDNGTTLAVNRDQQSGGPNPWFDIRAFGGFIANSPGTMTCTINSGSATLNCTSNPDFKDATGIPGSSLGHGVVIPGAGATPTITTPGTPTITPNLLNGATTWNYKVIAEDYKGGLTAATVAGTTSIGQATLGATTFAISSATRTSGTSTYTTSSAHNLQPGMTVLICQFGGGVCPGTALDAFNGTKVVQTTPSATTFTTLDGDVPDGSETPASGQGKVLSCNTLSYAAGSYSGNGTLRYWIYRSLGAGAYSLVGVAQGLDPYFVDCGVPAPPVPSYVPALPPGSAQAGYLATTISSGGGTNTLTLATTAGTTATSVTVVHDNGPNLIAAVNAAAAQTGGTVYIPSFPNNAGTTIFWQFNSLTDLATTSTTNSNVVTIKLAGNIFLTQPWHLRSTMLIEGATKRNATFMYSGGAWVASTAAPTFYLTVNSISVTLRNLIMNQVGLSGSQISNIFTDNDSSGAGPTGIILENVAVGGNFANGYGRQMVFKGGFDIAFRNVTCDGSLATTQLPFPCIEFTNSSVATFNGVSQVPGQVSMTGSYLIGSGIAVDNVNTVGSAAGTVFNFNGFIYESGYTPFLRIGPMGYTTNYNLTNITVADLTTASGTPVVDASGSQLGTISITDGIISGGIPPMVITSYPIASLILHHPPSPNRGSVPAVAFNQYNSETNNLPFNARGTGRFIYQMAVPGAPSGCVVSAGGAVPIGTVNYSLSAVDADGNETTPSTVATVVTTGGNQTVTCNTPSLPSGAIGFMAYHSFGAGAGSGGNKVFVGGCPTPQFTGATFVDSVNSNCGAASNTYAGSSILSSGGLASPSLRLVNGGIWTLTPSALTVNRAVTAPNLAGALGITTGSFTTLHGACFDLTGAASHLIDCGYIPFANPMTTAADIIIAGALGVAIRVAGPTSPNGIPQTLTSTPSGGVAVAPAWAIPGVANDAQTGTSYTIPITDDAKFLTGNNGSATAWTGFTPANNYVFSFMNLGAGLITYTPASGTVNGNATQSIYSKWFGFQYLDNNNVNTIMPLGPTPGAFPTCLDSSGNHLNFNPATNPPITCGTSSSGAAGIPYGSGAGSVNVMTVTTSPAVATNAAGTIVGVLPNLANTTTTPTLNVGGAGAQTIKKQGSSGALIAVQAGDYNIVSIAYFVSDGTVWQLLNPQLGQLGTNTYVDTTGNLQCLTNASCNIGTTNSIQQTNSNLFVAGNSFRGPSFNGGANGINITVQGGLDSSATTNVTEGGQISRGGDESGATGTNVGGYYTARGGMVTSAAGLQGVGNSGNGYFAGATVTQWNLQHITASWTVQDSAANAADAIGVATNAATPVLVIQNGNVPINASAAVTIGHTVCTGATAGKVTDSGGVAACTLGTSVGVVVATSGTYTVGSGTTTTSVVLSTTLPLIALKMD